LAPRNEGLLAARVHDRQVGRGDFAPELPRIHRRPQTEDALGEFRGGDVEALPIHASPLPHRPSPPAHASFRTWLSINEFSLSPFGGAGRGLEGSHRSIARGSGAAGKLRPGG